MKASSTGGLCGVTREHFSNAPDHVLEWVLELTGGVFDGISPTALKLGAVTPLPKDDTRFRPITLLEPIMKLVTGTVAFVSLSSYMSGNFLTPISSAS